MILEKYIIRKQKVWMFGEGTIWDTYYELGTAKSRNYENVNSFELPEEGNTFDTEIRTCIWIDKYELQKLSWGLRNREILWETEKNTEI